MLVTTSASKGKLLSYDWLLLCIIHCLPDHSTPRAWVATHWGCAGAKKERMTEGKARLNRLAIHLKLDIRRACLRELQC